MSAPVLTISPEQAQAMLRFMSTAQILGQDAPVFMECVFALQMIATHKEEPSQPADDQKPNSVDHSS